ncbi:MAG: anthranilate phosphoribosyltransferase [Hyphomicrobiales bacterium]|nr:anthranilate phosphoribosyltransferase [Hyphomicrobiales bacterium]
MSNLKEFIAIVADGNSLNRIQTQTAFSILMSGEATPSQIGGLLMAMRVRGESVEEFVGAVLAMRAKMLAVDAPSDAVDIVGTGGDASGSYNVSTCAAIVAAGAGLTIAKHGNRSLSSKSGSADVLVALGVNLELSPGQISDCIEEAGVGFMFAPAHHSAMRHVGPTRIELGTRTIFNLLGPMCNPAGVKRQLLGVFSPKWLLPVAKTLAELGSEKVWVMHGEGLDEITITGTTQVAALENGRVNTFEITPQDAGLPIHDLSQILGGDAQYNAAAMSRVLEGEPSAYRDIVLLNAGAALVIADKAEDIRDGVNQAAIAIDNGHAKTALEKLVRVSNQGLA